MKKFILLAIVLVGGFFAYQNWNSYEFDIFMNQYFYSDKKVLKSEAKQENQNQKDEIEDVPQDTKFGLLPLPRRQAEVKRMRMMELNDYVPIGKFVKKGSDLIINVQELPKENSLTIYIGEVNNYFDKKEIWNPQFVDLKMGENKIKAERDGLVYFRYTYPDSVANKKATVFELGDTFYDSPLYVAGVTKIDDFKDVVKKTLSPKVQFVSNRAIITINKKTLTNTYEWNKIDFDETFKILHGIIALNEAYAGLDNSKPAHKITPLRVHYIEDNISSSKEFKSAYMYAADTMIGMKSENVEDLIDPKKLSTQWSIWHETGHLFQQWDWTWDNVSESTVNLFALDVQRAFGQESRLETPEASGKTSIEMAKTYLAKKDKNFNSEDFADVEMIWPRLVMFEELHSKFGAGFYKKLFQSYRENGLNRKYLEDSDFMTKEFKKRTEEISGTDMTKFWSKWRI